MEVGPALTVIAEDFELFDPLGIVAADRSAVAEATEILAREEAESSVGTDGADPAALVFRADGLTGVFDHDEPMLLRQGHDRVHVGRLTEEVDRYDRLGVRGYFGFDRAGIDIERDRVDVREHRGRADPHDGSDGGEERERRGDDLVSCSDPFGHQRDDQRVRAAAHAHRAGGAAVGGHLLFKGLDFGTEYEALAVADLLHDGHDFRFERGVLGPEVQKGNLHFSHSHGE